MHQAKADIFNLALDALMLSRRITDVDTDQSTENRVLKSHWSLVFSAVLQDLNLDSTSTQTDLQLMLENPNKLWKYAYRYPNDCAFFRRIQSCVRTDVEGTQIPRTIRMINGQKMILTNEYDAIGEYISDKVPVESLSPMAALCVAFKLASLSSSLVTGKGAAVLIRDIANRYTLAKVQAMQMDRLEGETLQSDTEESSFVRARIS